MVQDMWQAPLGGPRGVPCSPRRAAAAPVRPAGPGKGGLTGSQAAAQLALCNGSSSHVNGLVPVRTGLAWATLGVQHRPLACSTCVAIMSLHTPAQHAILNAMWCRYVLQAWLLPASSLG